MKSVLSFAILSLIISLDSIGQTIPNPSYGLKSHETLEVTGVEITKDYTEIQLTVENRVVSGYFCVDRNTFILLPDGSRLKLIKADGIPNCPQSYTFKRIGEVIRFSLKFPALTEGSDWFNLVEECSENCFSVYGITLDSRINEEIGKAYSLSDSGKPAEAAAAFISVISLIGNSKQGILGSLYSSTIVMFLRSGDEPSAKIWYEKLSKSDLPDKVLYIDNLGSRGIKW